MISALNESGEVGGWAGRGQGEGREGTGLPDGPSTLQVPICYESLNGNLRLVLLTRCFKQLSDP